MILKQTVHIPKYDWKVTVFYNTICPASILEALHEAGCKGQKLREIADFLYEEKLNTGVIYSNPTHKETVIAICKATSLGEYVNTIEHEKNHLEMHLCEYLGIDPYSEEAAILSGDISQLFLDTALSSLIKY